jgi:hypothetical protein
MRVLTTPTFPDEPEQGLLRRNESLFGAKLLGNAVLDNDSHKSIKATLFQLNDPDVDTDFLEKQLDSFHRNPSSVVKKLPNVNVENHEELAKEALEKAVSLLKALKNREITHPPIIIAVLDEQKKLLGISIGHIERQLKGGQKFYTPLINNLEEDVIFAEDQDVNHSSINWLVRFASAGIHGVGKLLTAVNETLLPSSVKRVDVVSEVLQYTPQAPLLYSGFGFKKVEDLQDFANPKLHGVPMSTARETYKQKSEEVLNQMKFKADEREININLTE